MKGVQCTISFTASQSTISLSFSDFKPGTISNMEQITYTITGNAVSKTQDIILVRMDDTFNGIEVQSEMGGYSTVAGNAHLESSNAGYVTISTVDTGIANKVTDSGDGLLLDGNFPISYRANITQTQPAGQQTRTVIVTFAHH